VFNNTRKLQNKAKIKEVVQVVQSLIAQGVNSGELDETVDSEAWLVSHLNATKVCHYPEQCTKLITPTYPSTGVVLPTGVAIDFYQVGSTYSLFYMDVDGGAVNPSCDDCFLACYNPTGQSLSKEQGNWCMPQQPGQLSPISDTAPWGDYWYTFYLSLYK
jgi:hypothetical protein